jgi:hypothetical protein
MKAYYNFDGNADECVSGIDGTLINAPSLTTDKHGNSNRAYSFDGVDDGINLGTTLAITGELTYSAWIKTSDPGAIVGKYDNGANKRSSMLYMAGNGRAQMYTSLTGTAGGTVTATSPLSYDDNQWHHFVGTYKPSTYVRIYVDGDLKTENTSSVPSALWNVSPEDSLIGMYTNNGNPEGLFGGIITDVTVWTRALSGAEVEELYQKTNAAYVDWCLAFESSSSSSSSSFSSASSQSESSESSESSKSSGSSSSSLYEELLRGMDYYWNFNGDGDECINGYDAVPTNGPTLIQDQVGNNNRAYLFDGVDEYMTVTPSPYAGRTETTTAFWVKFNDLGGNKNQLVMGGDNPRFSTYTSDYIAIFASSSNTVYFSQAGGYYLPMPTEGTWEHIVLTTSNSNGRRRVYHNGVLKHTETGSVAWVSVHRYRFAARGADSLGPPYFIQSFDGALTDITMWDRELSEAEVRELYDKTKDKFVNWCDYFHSSSSSSSSY